eukprot:TRINITY_DN12726_c0_g1_i5.p1 TRINITY_DN12726_c0_g1~~TRINITY_DN12726_c0_g1_i5.p1  ORF type:complete len:151 (-),score=24.00 TRINITY_DN12726_c0_g1_i5:18-470(-)
MPDVDLMGQIEEHFRVTIHSKQWWWPVFISCLDLNIQQVWHVYRQTDISKQANLYHLPFHRAVAKVYLLPSRSCSGAPWSRQGRPVSMDRCIPEAVRFDRLNHLLVPWPTQLGCSLCDLKTKHKCLNLNTGVYELPYLVTDNMNHPCTLR